MDKIDKPGVYPDIPMEIYHGDLCVGPSISSSGLRTIEERSPEHFYETSYLNPNRTEKDSPALSFGRAAHCLLLGDEVFANAFVLPPFEGTYNRNEDGWKAGEKQAWKADQIERGMTVLRHEDIADIERMRDKLAADPIVQGGVFRGEVEQSIVWQDRETGVWLKARPDVIPAIRGDNADDTLADYKTIDDAREFKITRSLVDRLYAQQLALCAEGLWETRRQIIRCFVLVFQEKSPPFSVVTQEVSPDWIWRGAQLNRRAIRTFAECIETGVWPSYDIPAPALVPKWLHERLQAEEDAGLLPAAPAWCEEIKKMEHAA